MRRPAALALTIAATCTAGIALVPALPVGQAPNQAQMVTQAVAGVKFSTLPGFVIERVNPPDKSDSYVALTFDSLGRLVVSKELDHPRLLLDTDNDGVYESEKIITDKVRNCQGLWFDGRAMYGSCVHVQKAQEAASTPAAGGTRGQSESTGRCFQDGGLEQRRRGGYAGDPGHGGRNPGARSARHSAPPRRRDGRDCRQQRNDCRRSPRSHLTGVEGQGRSVSAQLPQLRRQRARGSAQRDLRLEPGVEEVPRVLRR